MLIEKNLRQPVTVSEIEQAERCRRGRVVVIDDDLEILSAFSGLLELSGYACESYASAIEYLRTLNDGQADFPGPCCVLCDVKLPEMDGLQLQRRLAELGDTPIVMMSGSSGVEEAVCAFRAGGLDFLIKPIDADHLLTAVEKALAISSQRQALQQRQANLAERIASLTEREKEITRRVAQGQTNPVIAAELKIALRTVKLYRQRAMKKVGAETIADFIRIVYDGNV
jgi:two-component system response regulator FixJ